MSGKTWLSTRRWDRGSDRAADPQLPLLHWRFRLWIEFFALLPCSEATYKLSSPLRSSVTTGRDDLGHAQQTWQEQNEVNIEVTLLSRLGEENQSEVSKRMGKLRGEEKKNIYKDFHSCLLQTPKSYTKPSPSLVTSGGPRGFQMVYKRRVRALSALHEVTSPLGALGR